MNDDFVIIALIVDCLWGCGVSWPLVPGGIRQARVPTKQEFELRDAVSSVRADDREIATVEVHMESDKLKKWHNPSGANEVTLASQPGVER